MRTATVVAIIVALGGSAAAETGAPPRAKVVGAMEADKRAAVTKAVAAGLPSFDPEDRVAVIGFAEKPLSRSRPGVLACFCSPMARQHRNASSSS